MNNHIIWKYLLLGLTMGISAVLFYVSVSPVYLVETDVRPQYIDQREINIDNSKEVKFHDLKDRLTCNITGTLKDPLIQGLTLKIRPSHSMRFLVEKIRVKASFFEIPVEVESPGSISTQTDFSYELSSNQGTLISQGSINLEIKDQMSATKPWIINITTAVGFLASILQIIELMKTRAYKKRAIAAI